MQLPRAQFDELQYDYHVKEQEVEKAARERAKAAASTAATSTMSTPSGYAPRLHSVGLFGNAGLLTAADSYLVGDNMRIEVEDIVAG